LKELLWNLDGLGKGKLLEPWGPAWQNHIEFSLIERGFRVFVGRLFFADGKHFLRRRKPGLRDGDRVSIIESLDMTPGGRAKRFPSMKTCNNPKSTFDAGAFCGTCWTTWSRPWPKQMLGET